MTEWDVVPRTTSVAAGVVVFLVTNDGTTPHDFVVLRTDDPPDSLAVGAGVVVTEGLDVLVETEDIGAGGIASVSTELEAGDYVLICNVAGHYDLGMRTAFTVN